MDYKIETLRMEHFDEAYELLKTDFLPDEPLFATCGPYDGSIGISEKIVLGDLKDDAKRTIESGDSFGAFDEHGNLLGVRMGCISNFQNCKK